MAGDYEVGYGKPPAKTKFQKGKSGNPRGRPKRKYPPEELDFQKALIAELKSPMTINEAGNKKKVAKLEAFVKALVARAFQDKAMMKCLLDYTAKLPKEAFADDKFITYRVHRDLLQQVEQDAAEWRANFSEATNSGARGEQREERDSALGGRDLDDV